MLTLRRHGPTATERDGTPRRVRSAVISVGLHALLAVALWQVLQFPRALGYFLDQPGATPSVERLRFLRVAPARVTAPAVPRSFAPPRRTPVPLPSGEASSVTQPAAAPVAPLVAPTEVPTRLPPAVAGSAITGPSSGPLITGRGAVRGVQPGYTEPRIWIESPAVTGPALEGDAKLDSAVSAIILAYRDSVIAGTYLPSKFERGDWTHTTKDGKKYGIDQRFIRLGKVSIPTALLGLLPMNQLQGNPIANERQRRLDAMRVEILAQAEQAMNEEEFRRAVRQIRERKERERKDAEKKKRKEEKVIS